MQSQTILSFGKTHLYKRFSNIFFLLLVRAIVQASSQFSVCKHTLIFYSRLLYMPYPSTNWLVCRVSFKKLSPTAYKDCSWMTIEDLFEKLDKSTPYVFCDVLFYNICSLLSMLSSLLIILSWNCSIICLSSLNC